jgi:hypothetical protein
MFTSKLSKKRLNSCKLWFVIFLKKINQCLFQYVVKSKTLIFRFIKFQVMSVVKDRNNYTGKLASKPVTEWLLTERDEQREAIERQREFTMLTMGNRRRLQEKTTWLPKNRSPGPTVNLHKNLSRYSVQGLYQL